MKNKILKKYIFCKQQAKLALKYIISNWLGRFYPNQLFTLKSSLNLYSETINVHILPELTKLIKSEVIDGDITVRGKQIKSLSGVKIINGTLGLADTSLESLGSLEQVNDIWSSVHHVCPKLKSLGNLRIVKENLGLRYSTIESLGNLKVVGGNLSLRDTNILDLGQLNFVGGNLFLPEKAKGIFDLSKIKIGGKIRYWNDNHKKNKPKKNKNTTLISFDIPYWKPEYIYSFDEIYQTNKKQQQFYKNFRNNFFEKKYINLVGNNNYAFILLFDILNLYSNHNNFSKLKKHLSNLKYNYPITANHVDLNLIKQMNTNQSYDESWGVISTADYISIKDILFYEKELKRKLVNGKILSKIGSVTHLTVFGQNNIENILKHGDQALRNKELELGAQFMDLFFDKGFMFKSLSSSYDPQYYKKFYSTELEFNHYKEMDESLLEIKNDDDLKHVVNNAIKSQARIILKEAEDLYRISVGMPKIGEGWISETELFYKITKSFSSLQVIQHASPSWLGRQHFDIYISDYNIALEYQGKQHYEAIEFFGGEEGFRKTQERDAKKIKKCKENNCKLIYVNKGYDFNKLVNEIQLLMLESSN